MCIKHERKWRELAEGNSVHRRHQHTGEEGKVDVVTLRQVGRFSLDFVSNTALPADTGAGHRLTERHLKRSTGGGKRRLHIRLHPLAAASKGGLPPGAYWPCNSAKTDRLSTPLFAGQLSDPAKG
jgi:hypothetical protein